MVALKADACDCSNGYCREFCTPTTECVYRRARDGEVKTDWCVYHSSDTWHLNGKCLKCAANEAVIEVGKYLIYRRNGILWLKRKTDEGAAVKLDGVRERAFEIGLEKIFDAYSN